MQNNPKKTIGIIGGVGPMAGVLLQKLIIEMTPAHKDQEHIPVITYTNPNIPDRTASLLGPKAGMDFVFEIQKTANILARAGAQIIALPCNTAHARFVEIQKGVPVPIINMVFETVNIIRKKYGNPQVGLLATDGTIFSGIYQSVAPDIEWLLPSKEDQKEVMKTIYGIKSGSNIEASIIKVTRNLVERGAEVIITGCTELSLIYSKLIVTAIPVPIVDSSRTLAKTLVKQVFNIPVDFDSSLKH